MHRIIITLLLFVIHGSGNAQQSNYTAFTTNDGLPSNHVYRCVEDDYGFLWVATDAGIARFDGKHFQVFTTDHGLPDNEVLQVVKEKSGRIWINCFKQSPAYFDEAKNRFVNAKEDSNLAKVTGTANMNLFVLNDGVMYYNEHGSYVFKNKQLHFTNKPFFIKENSDNSVIEFLRLKSNITQEYANALVLRLGNKYLDTITLLGRTFISSLSIGNDQKNFYLFDGRGKCFIFSNLQIKPLRYRVDSVVIPESYFSYAFTDQSFYMVSNSAKIYVFSKQTLQFRYVLNGNYIPNNFYDDSKGNRWLCTIDKGLLVLRKKYIAQVETPVGFTHNNFISIARKENGNLLAGNYYGEVVEAGAKKNTIYKVVNKNPSRLKKILVSGKDVYTVSDADHGLFLNYSTQLLSHLNGFSPLGGKTGIICNDTLILAGTTYGILRINTRLKKMTNIVRFKRSTAMAIANEAEVYYGSTDGLYKYNHINNKFKSFNQNHPLLTERVTALSTDDKGLLWMSTSSNGVAVLLNDTLLQHITSKDGLISNSFRCMTAAKPGQVWLGSSQGISIVDYKLTDGRLRFSVRNLSINDGLTSNEINEMIFHNDTVYAATGNGISVIPINTSFPKFHIPVKLVRMNINGRDTVISNQYQLTYNQQNLQMQFAGIELNGHFKNLQYKLDETNSWIELNENSLSLQLNHGPHTLHVRAVDVNGNISNKILALEFNIATPFWKALWFWISIAVVIQLLTIYFVSQWLKKRKQTKLAKEIAGVQTASLEQQAFTSLMNPHFMFNALNSIQHYINVQDRRNANRYLSDFASLIRKNFEAAQQSFIPLEQELENLKIYLRLEQMRFADRFTYQIIIDDLVDLENWMIPTMMLQPLLENALLHGIMPSGIHGEITIDLKEVNKNLWVTITDNGIGIKQSKELKQHDQHKSRGMELIKKRIVALSHFVEQAITLEMSPAFVSDKNPGNKIVLCLPEKLHKAWLLAQQK